MTSSSENPATAPESGLQRWQTPKHEAYDVVEHTRLPELCQHPVHPVDAFRDVLHEQDVSGGVR